MNYRALIENRKSVREFTDKKVSKELIEQIRSYYRNDCHVLLPDIKTRLYIYGDNSKEALEGAAGYNRFLVGSSQYLVLMSEKHEFAKLNAGFLMQDMVLKLADLGLDSCWVTFTDSDRVKEALQLESELEVAAIIAFGYGVKTTKRLRLNILSMSNVDISAKRGYYEPKKGISDLVFLNEWGNTDKVNDHIGFFEDMLWNAFYAVSQSPSYLNRQAYGFVIRDGSVTLVRRPDEYTPDADAQLSLGIAMFHFTAAASDWAGNLKWRLGCDAGKLELPDGHAVVASCTL